MKKEATIQRQRTVFTIAAIVMLNVFLVNALPGSSAETRVADNTGAMDYTSFREGDSEAIQHMGTALRPGYVYEHFKDFAIPVYNETGKCRVLLCDIVLELNDGITFSNERQRLRKLLFRTSQSLSHGVVDIRSMKQKLCDRIKSAVNEAVGKDAVKDVQMTRFLLL